LTGARSFTIYNSRRASGPGKAIVPVRPCMKTAVKVFAIALIVATAGFSTSCFEDSKDPITVKIISQGTDAEIGGYIIADDNLPYTLTTMYTNSTMYYSQITLNDVDSLYINAAINDSGYDADVSIIIYRRTNDTDIKAKEISTTLSGSSSNRSVVLTYEYGEEDTTTDSTTTSSSSN
jgi:hypothetical protein